MNTRLKQAVVGMVVVSSVGAVSASVTLSQLQGAARIRRAVKSELRTNFDRNLAPSVVTPSATMVAAGNLSRGEFELVTRTNRAHSVKLQDGTIRGAIQSIDDQGTLRKLTDVKVSFYKNGALITEVTPGSDGVFQAALGPGSYTLVALGPNGYVAYGVEAIDPTVEIRSAGHVVSKVSASSADLQVESLAIPKRDFAAVYRLIRSVKGSDAAGVVEESVPSRADNSEALPDVSSSDAPPQTNLKQHTVHLQPEGGLLGRMRRIDPATGQIVRVKNLNVFLVQNGAVVTQTGVAEDGSFKFGNVAPGTYSFVSSGRDGFSAFSIVVAAAATATSASGLLPVSFQPDAGGVTGSTADPSVAGPATEGMVPPPGDPAFEEGPPPFEGGAGGGFGGGPGGGGFGGGGGGGGIGVGGLLGLAGLGVGIAAYAEADDNDDNNGPVSPAGP